MQLFRENDKDTKIKSNSKNVIDYLKQQDFWEEKVYKNEKFNLNLNELKKIKIQVNQILWLYNYLVRDKEIDEYKIIEEIIKEGNQPVPYPPVDWQNNQDNNDDDEDNNSDSESNSNDASNSDSESEKKEEKE